MRHFTLFVLMSTVAACSSFDGPTGSGGGGSDSATSSTASTGSTGSAATTTATSSGQGGSGGSGGGSGGASDGGGGSASDGGGGTGGTTTSTGGGDSFSCADVDDGSFTVKVRSDFVSDTRAIRLVGTVDYPDGSGMGDLGWGVRGTGSVGQEEVSFDLGQAPGGTRTEFTLGTTFDGVDPGDSDGILDGDYYCPDVMPYACTVDILGCFGGTEVARYEDGTASGTFSFAASDPNPIITVP